MKIAGLQRVTLIDYPGRIAATVFLAGCNLDCGYCYNRWMLDANAVKALLSVDELLRWLQTRQGLLDGVCLSGGEPTLHPELVELLRALRALGFAIKVDTNGTLPHRLKALLDEGLVDYVALDLKAPLDARYERVARRTVDLAALRQSMDLLRRRAPAYEFRTTVNPMLCAADLEAIATEIGADETWYLQPFLATESVTPDIAQATSLDAEALRTLAERLRRIAPGARLRGEQ